MQSDGRHVDTNEMGHKDGNSSLDFSRWCELEALGTKRELRVSCPSNDVEKLPALGLEESEKKSLRNESGRRLMIV